MITIFSRFFFQAICDIRFFIAIRFSKRYSVEKASVIELTKFQSAEIHVYFLREGGA
jgi:hypothetical protein